MKPLSVVFQFILTFAWIWNGSMAQMSTDPRLCGGYFRETRGFIDFRFNENTAPPSIAQGNKFCMWTLTPTVPNQQWRYNITIRNVNLNCSDHDSIAINYFDEHSNSTNLGLPADPSNPNPLCIEDHIVWRRENVPGTTMVIILYVKEVRYDKGFYLEWEPGWDSHLTPFHIRNTFYSYGRPSVAPNPYFAGGAGNNEIATWGFIKANYTDGYTMEMYFEKISMCFLEDCYTNYLTLYSVEKEGTLQQRQQFNSSQTTTPAQQSPNGFFFIVKGEDNVRASLSFTLQFDTVRG